MFSRVIASLVCATGLLAGPSLSAAPQQEQEQETRLGIWCEFMPYEEVHEYLPLLAAYDCELLLHVKRGDVKNPALFALWRAADTAGVRVAPWLLLPDQEHIYVGEETLDAFARLSHALLDALEHEKLRASWLVFDCEPSFILGRDMVTYAADKDWRGLARFLKQQRDPARFERAQHKLNEIVNGLHPRGVRVHGAGNRTFLDAQRFGNLTYEDALGVPFSHTAWDRVSFITYRYQVSQAAYLAMIHHYAGLAHHFYGARAALDLGLTGNHRDIPGHRQRAKEADNAAYYMSFLDGMEAPGNLAEAVGVGLRRGVHCFNLYSLDGAARSKAGLEAWLKAARKARPSRGNPLTSLRAAELSTRTRLAEYFFRAVVGRKKYNLPEPSVGKGQ